MTDATTSELERPGEKVTQVNKLRNIPRKPGSLFLNSAHVDELKEGYAPALENDATTLYRVTRELADNKKDFIDPFVVATIDVDKLGGSLLVYSENFMVPFMNVVRQQVKNDFYIAQASKMLVDAGIAENYRYVRSRRGFMNNAKSVLLLLEKLDKLDEFDSVEGARGEIEDVIKQGEALFGKGKKFGKGDKGYVDIRENGKREQEGSK